MKHYMDIQRLKVSFVDGFQKGDYIYIQEKIDGANFSIKYDAASDTVKAFSRKQELNEMNTLRGAWNFAQSLDKEKVAEVLGDNVILFGEWLVKHSVPYPAERYNQAYFYDAFDTATGEYLPQNLVISMVELLGLNYVPIFYIGDFISWDHIKSFIGKTELGGEYGEGCFKGDMNVLMADGSQKKIKDVEIGDLVKTYNEKTGNIEDKKVVNKFNNGLKPQEEWRNISVFSKGVSGAGLIGGRIIATKNHKFYDGNGWTPIESLEYVYHYGDIFDEYRKQAFLGLLVSDMHLNKNIFYLSQAESKSSDFEELFKPFLAGKKEHISPTNSKILILNFKLQKTVQMLNDYTKDDKILYLKVFSELDDIGWAFFFMGDGYGAENGTMELSLASYSIEECKKIKEYFEKHFNIQTTLSYDERVTNGCGGRLRTTAADGRKILKQISRYIMPNYRYKLQGISNADEFIGIPAIKQGITKRKVHTNVPISEIKSLRNNKNFTAWDLEVEDNHNYFINGVLVHNCVVKNQTRLNDPNNKLPFYVKLVGEKFAETKGHKEGKRLDPALVAEREKKIATVETIVTRARVQKMLHKFVDEGIIPEDWDETTMGTIAKNIGKAIYADCVKEEKETVDAVGAEFGKLANSVAMKNVKEILAERTSI